MLRGYALTGVSLSLLHPLSVRRVVELNPGELARVRLFSGLALVIATQDEGGKLKLVSLDRGPPNREELRPPTFVSKSPSRDGSRARRAGGWLPTWLRCKRRPAP